MGSFGAVSGRAFQSQNFGDRILDSLGVFSAAPDSVGGLVLIKGRVSSGFVVCLVFGLLMA